MDTPIPSTVIRRRRRLRFAAATAALILCAAAAWGVNRVVAPAVRISDVVISEVRRGSIANTIVAAGIVIPQHEEFIASPLSTRIAQVHARPGQAVAAGDLLLGLDDREPRLALERLLEQRAQQNNAIRMLTQEMEQKHKQMARQVELLDLDLQSAKAKFQRYSVLRASGGVSGEDMLAAELNVRRTEIQLLQQRELIEDNRRTTATRIDAARLQASILQKQIEQARQLLASMQVRAPISGVLTSLATEEGAAVSPGQTLARVAVLDNFRIESTLSDVHARSLSPGQPVSIEQGGQSLPGIVQTVLPEIRNGSVKVLIAPSPPNHGMLRNGLRVETHIVTAHKDGALIVDHGAALQGRGRQDVFVVRGDMAYKTPLEFGAGDGRRLEVLAGAREGDRLIVAGAVHRKEAATLRLTH